MSKPFANRPFGDLKKQLTKAKAPPAHPPSPRARAETEDDIFSDAMRDVQEISEFRVLPCAKARKHVAPQRTNPNPDAEALEILSQISAGKHPINLSDTQEYVEWTNPVMQEVLTEQLHAGRFAVQGMLDLHGFTGDEVNAEIDSFLKEAFRRDWRCVKIIHGRGLRSVKGPVLKDAVIRRLLGQYRKRITAFVSARQCDGGLGAMYVLLQS
jgi:DNA-nicking Smr family endonuclease